MNQSKLWILSASAAIVVAFSANIAFAAWTGPTATAPAGNTATPVNVGTSSQYKLGGFQAGVIVSDNIVMGTQFCFQGPLNCITSWPAVSQWTTSGTSIYYNGGNVGIGTANPNFPLTMSVTNGDGLTMNGYGGTPNAVGKYGGTVLRGFSARGTAVAPTMLHAGDSLLRIHASGFWTGKANGYFEPNDTRFEIAINASEDWIGPSNNGTEIAFATTPNGSPTPRGIVKFDPSGNVGIGTMKPSAKLDVVGTIRATDVSAPTSGKGIELYRDSIGRNRIVGYDRDTPAWEDVYVDGANTIIQGLKAGNVGIGVTAPLTKLQVFGDVRVGTTGLNGCLKNFGGGAIAGTCSSDARLKNVNGGVSNVLEGISRLDLVTFHWNDTAAELYHNDTTASNTGFIAQDVQKQFPELVTADSNGYYQLDYATLGLYGIKAIKEQQQEIGILQQQLKQQQQTIDDLQVKVQALMR